MMYQVSLCSMCPNRQCYFCVLGLYHVTLVKCLLSVGSKVQEKTAQTKIKQKLLYELLKIFLLDSIFNRSQIVIVDSTLLTRKIFEKTKHIKILRFHMIKKLKIHLLVGMNTRQHLSQIIHLQKIPT